MLRPTFRTKYSRRDDNETAEFGLESSNNYGECGDVFVDAIDQNFTGEKLPFPTSERDIYEMQLTQLQEQLVAVMIENQDMKQELDTLKATELEQVLNELKEEKHKSKELSKQLETKKVLKLGKKNEERKPKVSQTAFCVNPEDVETHQGNDWVYLDDSQQKRISSVSSKSTSSLEADTQTRGSTSSQTNGIQEKIEPVINSKPVSRIQTVKSLIFYQFMEFISDFLDNGSDDDEEQNDVDEPLAVKRLKENITRFGTAIQPITGFIKSVNNISTWTNPAATLVAFMIYLYSVWKGYFVSLILLIIIWKLTINYLRSQGILSSANKENAEEDKEEIQRSLSDKFQLVLQVAAKVQNKLGDAADSLEKIKNLLMWQHLVAAKKLYFTLCVIFLASVFLPAEIFFRICAMQLGVKIFLVSPIYKKFPKVQKRHDTVTQLWTELPTDADLLAARDANASNSDVQSSDSCHSVHPNVTETNSHQSEEMSIFHEKFGLPSSEHPLPGWELGYRCTLMNKDKPLAQMKHGRLYLTINYLCYERSALRFAQNKNIAIPLSEITQLLKAKPLSFMPGTGMALEVQVSGLERPYIFGGIIGRDEAFGDIHRAGQASDLPWASCPSSPNDTFSPTVHYVRNRVETN